MTIHVTYNIESFEDEENEKFVSEISCPSMYQYRFVAFILEMPFPILKTHNKHSMTLIRIIFFSLNFFRKWLECIRSENID